MASYLVVEAGHKQEQALQTVRKMGWTSRNLPGLQARLCGYLLSGRLHTCVMVLNDHVLV